MLKSNSKLSLLVVSDTLNERESKNKMNGQYIDIIFLALIAAVLIYRLARVLGSEVDENKDNNTEQKNEIRENTQDNVVSIAMHGQKEFVGALAAYDEEETKKDPIKAVFYKIYSLDKSFSPEKFLTGAKAAFEMIIEAFIEGDEDTLKKLVSKDVLESFKKAIAGYKENNQKVEQSLIGFTDAKIIKADLEGTEAKLTVEFVTEQSKAVVDADGNVVEGDAVMISTVKDIWVFAKDLEDSSPNWMLVSTKGGN